MIGRLRDLTMNPDRSFNVTITVKKDFREKFDQLKDKDLDIEIKQHREIRSKNANAYFHVLVNKIANETMESDEAVKVRLVTEYGVVDRTETDWCWGSSFRLPSLRIGFTNTPGTSKPGRRTGNCSSAIWF